MGFSGTELREACGEAARRGGVVLAERFSRPRTIDHKGRRDLVTDADRASEEVVLGFLRGHYPGAAILAEESGEHAGAAKAELRFYVDPLDGTTNYAHGVPHFSVSVAVADGEGLLAGAILDPLRGELFLASRGGGAFLGDRRLAVSDCGRLQDALLVTGFAYDWTVNAAHIVRVFGELTAQSQGMRRMGSAALDLAYVAAGRFDGYWEERLKPWDIAAGLVLVREAGGAVADHAGGGRMLETGNVLAAAPALLGSLIEAVKLRP